MTVWHLSVSCKLHLAHLASPWIVTSLPLSASARTEVEVVRESRSAPATPARTVFSFIVIVIDFDVTVYPTGGTGFLFKDQTSSQPRLGQGAGANWLISR